MEHGYNVLPKAYSLFPPIIRLQLSLAKPTFFSFAIAAAHILVAIASGNFPAVKAYMVMSRISPLSVRFIACQQTKLFKDFMG